MSLRLDDLLLKKKEPVQILDLSKCTANSKEELKRLLEKVPEYKIKMEKIKPEDIRLKERNFKFKTPKKTLKSKRSPLADPVPVEMRSLRLEYLYSVDIQWKMLTLQRPKNKIEEEYFTRIIELGKLTLQTRKDEKSNPNEKYIKKIRKYGGIIETRVLTCSNCGEEFCTGEACQDFLYEDYHRINDVITTSVGLETKDSAVSKKKKKKKKPKKKKVVKKKSTLASFVKKFDKSTKNKNKNKIVTNVSKKNILNKKNPTSKMQPGKKKRNKIIRM